MTQQEYNKARALKETAIANMKVLELRKMQGELVEVEQVRATWAEALGNFRRALDDLPKAIATRAAMELELDKQGCQALHRAAKAEVDTLCDRLRRDVLASDN